MHGTEEKFSAEKKNYSEEKGHVHQRRKATQKSREMYIIEEKLLRREGKCTSEKKPTQKRREMYIREENNPKEKGNVHQKRKLLRTEGVCTSGKHYTWGGGAQKNKIVIGYDSAKKDKAKK